VLHTFGLGSLDVTSEDFESPDRVLQLGVEPYRIDIITGTSGVTFDEAWNDRVQGEIEAFPQRS
jgi:hypothetical protein